MGGENNREIHNSPEVLAEYAKIPNEYYNVPFTKLCDTTLKLFDKANTCLSKNEEEEAYVHFLQIFSLVVEIMPKHAEYLVHKDSHIYLDLKNRAWRAFDYVENLKKRLKAAYDQHMSQAFSRKLSLDSRKETPFNILDNGYIEIETLSILLRKYNRCILFVDLREHIHHKYIPKSENYLHFPPGLLKGTHVSSQSLETSLTLGARDLFNRRNTFELIVFFDESSTSFTDNPESSQIFQTFIDAVYHMEFNAIPKRKPLLLKGGIQAMCSLAPELVKEIVARESQDRSPFVKVEAEEPSPGPTPPVVPVIEVPIAQVPTMNDSSKKAIAALSTEKVTFPDLSVFLKPQVVPRKPYGLPPKPIPKNFRPTPPVSTISMPIIPIPSPPRHSNEAISHLLLPMKPNRMPSEEFIPVDPNYQRPLHIPGPPTPSRILPSAISPRPANLPLTQSPFVPNRYTLSPKPVPMLPLAPPVSSQLKQTGPMTIPPAIQPFSTMMVRARPPPLPQRTLPTDREIMLRSFTEKFLGNAEISSQSVIHNFGVAGLKNLGNTCFMNSIIQCVNAYPQLTRYFLSGEFRKNVNHSNKLGTGGILVEASYELFKAIWSGEYSIFSPISFKVAVCKFSARFEGSEQQDSQEFLAFFLDGLHEDLNWLSEVHRPPLTEKEERELEKLPDYILADIEWKRYLERNFSIIVGLFQGQLRSKVQCSKCPKTSSTFNSFMFLSLPIVKLKQSKSEYTLQSCLDGFLAEENLDDSNSWFCPDCKKRRSATKKLDLWRLPPVLIFHFKRFSFDGPFRDKIVQAVDFPTESLDMGPYLQHSAGNIQATTPQIYDLFAVSNHYGNLSGGHYKAMALSADGQSWNEFDDSRVTRLSKDTALKDKASAYILFYKKRI